VLRRREDTSNSYPGYVQYIQSADKSPPHEQEALKKEYSQVVIEKCYKGQNFIYFVATRELIGILHLTNCLHLVKFDNHNNNSDTNSDD
jgi:hypothetical protein